MKKEPPPDKNNKKKRVSGCMVEPQRRKKGESSYRFGKQHHGRPASTDAGTSRGTKPKANKIGPQHESKKGGQGKILTNPGVFPELS